MANIIKIKPARSGVNVPFPAPLKQFVRADGDYVEPSLYWNRRISQGDVEIVNENEIQNEQTEIVSDETKKSTKKTGDNS